MIPKLGVAGAAIATVMSRYIETIIVVLWAHKTGIRTDISRALTEE